MKAVAECIGCQKKVSVDIEDYWDPEDGIVQMAAQQSPHHWGWIILGDKTGAYCLSCEDKVFHPDGKIKEEAASRMRG